ncbi:MAG: DUF5690 family protein [Thermoflexibacter sp.]|nr:DUF5690 family protein [Thermoflexibacter sp.]
MKLIKQYLSKSPTYVFVMVASLAAFSTYSCMYAYRKSFSVGIFENMDFLGIDYKSLLIIAQVLGYMSSKFLGIKIISEMKANNRMWAILSLIGFSELALVGFAFIPAPYNIACLFLNGLPLGMIWGLVFSYLEGRKTTEILGAILSLSFIIANNISKSLAQTLLQNGVSEFVMPYVVGLIFGVPLFISVFLLNQIPPPNAEDEKLRVKRVPMDAKSRWQSFQFFALGLSLLIINYMFLTAYRDLQSNFASNIWLALGYAQVPSIYLTTTIPIALIVLLMMSLLYLVKDNFKALLSIQAMIIFGLLMIGLSTFAFEKGLISGVTWVILTGAGTYLCYIPFNCFVFERTIAAFKVVGNAGFFMYLADSFGYLASVGTLLYKNFFEAKLSWYQFIINSSYTLTFVGIIFCLSTIYYYNWKYKNSLILQ